MSETLNRYARQALFQGLGEEGQQQLGGSTVAVVGLGALGSVSAGYLARAGVGRVRLIDRDVVDESNLHRQVLYTEEDARLGLPKAAAAAAHLALANSTIILESRIDDLTSGNVDALLADVDVVVDGTDNFETRYLINDWAIHRSRPWIYGAAVGSYGVTLTIQPQDSACLTCVFETAPPADLSPTCETAGVIGPITGVIASLQAGEAMKLLSGNSRHASRALQVFDLWAGQVQRVEVARQPEDACPACGRREHPYLEGRAGSAAARLCGRNAVQVRPQVEGRVDLPSLARRLASAGEVVQNPYLVRFSAEGCDFTVFADGRSLVTGTDDPARARTLVSRYIGA